jgi:hypothetical protein
MKKYRGLSLSILSFFFLFPKNVFSQKIVDVDLLTGAANVSIPVYNIRSGDISVPIVFYYHAGGIKVEDYNQQVGLGWRINLEASVTRVMRGFPDDITFQGNSSYNVIKGWIRSGSTNIPTTVENFTIAGGADPSGSTCANEVTDYSYMNSNSLDNYDTDPDIFMVNAPGLSLQFAFDKNGNIQVMPFQDVIISKTTDATTGAITSFTITNDRGIKYLFNITESTTLCVDTVATPSNLEAFRRDYVFFRKGASDPCPVYFSKWNLYSIIDTKGNGVYYTYDQTNQGPAPVANQKIQIVKFNPSTSTFSINKLYAKATTTVSKRLIKITGGLPDDILSIKGDMQFTWENSYTESKLIKIFLPKEGSFILPYYTKKYSGNNNGNSWGRYFLSSLVFSRNGEPQEYKFAYQDVDEGGSAYCTFTGNDSITNDQDYWGYFNGHATTPNTNLVPPMYYYPNATHKFRFYSISGYSGSYATLSGANRSVNTAKTACGSLIQITYPTGGITTLTYENNYYYDGDVGAGVLGGGIRVKELHNNDGINTTDGVTYYDYVDGSSVTSGRAISVPNFIVPFPNTNSYSTVQDKVNNCTYRTLYNFSDESDQVIYGRVTVRKDNGGKSVYEFNTDATWGASDVVVNTSDHEWYETSGNVTRNYTSTPGTCTTLTPDFLTAAGKNIYPFAANPNYDFHRGLLDKVTNYNQSGDKVSEESYTYTRSHTSATKIWGLKYDDVGTVRCYAKYDLVALLTKLIGQKDTKVYTSSTVYRTETENYTYPTSGDYRLPKTISKINSDGNTYKSYIQYVKDYSSGSGDAVASAITSMKSSTINNNLPVETYQTFTPNGGTEKVIRGSLTTYKAFFNSESGLNMYLPYETWTFASPAGVSTTGFASSISSTFSMNSNYKKSATVNAYDYGGNPVSVTNNARINNSVINDVTNNLRVAEFSNAKNTEVIYGPFDYTNYQENISGYSYSDIASPGHYSKSCLVFGTSTTLTRTISMATTNTNLIFSCWVKNYGAGGNVTITVNLSDGGSLNQNYTLGFKGSLIGSSWKYIEKTIPKPATSNPVTVSITTSLAFYIDDILMYPDNAGAKTYAYTPYTFGHDTLSKILLTAEKGLNGVAKTFTYDNIGRPETVRDKEDNIYAYYQYRKVNAWNPLGFTVTITGISWTGTFTVNSSISFTANIFNPSGATGLSYTWDFGDGTVVSGAGQTQAHTYTTAGNYTVTATVSGTGVFGSNSSQDISISSTAPPSITPSICAAGIVERTTDNQCVLSYCSPLTATCSNTKFKLDAITGGSMTDVEAVIWEKTPYGYSTWEMIGGGTTVTVNFATHTPSYQVRCRVYLTSGAWGTSNTITVLNNGTF